MAAVKIILIAALLVAATTGAFVSKVHLSPLNGAQDYTGIVYVDDEPTNPKNPTVLQTLVQKRAYDISQILKLSQYKASVQKYENKGLITSYTGRLDTDIADSRAINKAATEALELAVKAGWKKILLIIGAFDSANKVQFPTGNQDVKWSDRKYIELNTILGSLQGLYYPLHRKDMYPSGKYTTLYVDTTETKVIEVAKAIEEGRWIARDLCGSGPEEMNPQNFVKYVNDQFTSAPTVEDVLQQKAKYPLAFLINKVAADYPRYTGKILTMTHASGTANPSLFLVGQAVTFDTGGADIRVDGKMEGMSRDKCGGAAVVGFMKTAELLNSQLNVVAKIAVMRHSIGAKSYVADDIVMDLREKLIRIGFTQAKGRMLMAELVASMAGDIATATNPEVLSVATLSDHVVRTYKYVMGIMDNGPAAYRGKGLTLQNNGYLIGDLGEVSAVREEDFDAIKGPLETEDLINSSPSISETMPRGHQIAAAFVIKASGMYDEHGMQSNKPIPFTQLDVTGSAGRLNFVPTASPLSMMTLTYLKPTL